MTLESTSGSAGATGTNGASLHRADAPVMTVSRDSFEFSQFLVANSDLLIGMQPVVINPHEELVINAPKDISVVDVQARMRTIQLPEGTQLVFGAPYETVDFVVHYDNLGSTYQPRLRMAFVNNVLRDMRYIFAKQSEKRVQWPQNLEAREESIIAIMRKYTTAVADDQKHFDYMTLLRFFNEHCSISQIVHKINCDVSFGSEFDRDYADAGYRNEKGDKVTITDTHRISSVNHFMKAVISRSHRSILTPVLDHEYGLGTSIALLKGLVKPCEVVGVYTPTSHPTVGIDVEMRGTDAYRKMAADIAMQIIAATGSTEYGALARKGSLVA